MVTSSIYGVEFVQCQSFVVYRSLKDWRRVSYHLTVRCCVIQIRTNGNESADDELCKYVCSYHVRSFNPASLKHQLLLPQMFDMNTSYGDESKHNIALLLAEKQ